MSKKTKYNLVNDEDKEFILGEVTGERYEKWRMNELKYSGTQQFKIEEIATEFNLNKEEVEKIRNEIFGIKKYFENIVKILFVGSPEIDFKDLMIKEVAEADGNFILGQLKP